MSTDDDQPTNSNEIILRENDHDIAVISSLHNFAKINIGTILNDLSQSEYLMLFFVQRNTRNENSMGVNVSKIAHLMDISSPAVSRTLRSLEEKAYIKRVVDEKNRRNTYVFLTPAGVAAFEKDSRIISDFSTKITQRIGKERLESLISISIDLCRIISEEITNFVTAE